MRFRETPNKLTKLRFRTMHIVSLGGGGGGAKNGNSKAGYGVRADVDVAEMEKAQPLGEHRLAIDAVRPQRYFIAIYLALWVC